MNRFAGVTHALLRIVAGLLLFCPGAMKMFGWFGGMPAGVTMTPLLQAAGVIEVVAGAAIMFGLFTRPVAFVLSGLMAFAYWMGHGFNALLPVMNHGELAVIYCFVFLFLSAKGSGIWSLDGGS